MTRKRKRHLTVGWCWSCGFDGDLWGIYGHVADDEARAIVRDYEEWTDADVAAATVSRDWRRSVPCRRHECFSECSGSHLEEASPGPGASPYTWVTLAEAVLELADGARR